MDLLVVGLVTEDIKPGVRVAVLKGTEGKKVFRENGSVRPAGRARPGPFPHSGRVTPCSPDPSRPPLSESRRSLSVCKVKCHPSAPASRPSGLCPGHAGGLGPEHRRPCSLLRHWPGIAVTSALSPPAGRAQADAFLVIPASRPPPWGQLLGQSPHGQF